MNKIEELTERIITAASDAADAYRNHDPDEAHVLFRLAAGAADEAELLVEKEANRAGRLIGRPR